MKALLFTLSVVLSLVLTSCGNTYNTEEFIIEAPITVYDELKIEIEKIRDPAISCFEEVINGGNTAFDRTVNLTSNFDLLEGAIFFPGVGIYYSASRIIRFDIIDYPGGESDILIYFK